jgi:hypothetical protein
VNIKTSKIAISGIKAAQTRSPSVKELDPCTRKKKNTLSHSKSNETKPKQSGNILPSNPCLHTTMRRFGGFDLMRFVVFVIVPRTFEWIVRKMYVHNLMEEKEVRREVKWLTEPRIPSG